MYITQNGNVLILGLLKFQLYFWKGLWEVLGISELSNFLRGGVVSSRCPGCMPTYTETMRVPVAAGSKPTYEETMRVPHPVGWNQPAL